MQLDKVNYRALPIGELPRADRQDSSEPDLDLTLVYSVFAASDANPRFHERLREYAGYDEPLKRRFEIIIVDDCCGVPLVLPEDLDLNVRLFRVHEDITWNSCGGRNLGAVAARTDKLLMSDIDHLVPGETLSTLLQSRIAKGDWIVLERTDKVTANIYCTTRHTFFWVGGYDEQFSGCYGDDLPFRHKLKQLGVNFLRPGLIIERRKFHDHGLSRDLEAMHRLVDAWDGSASGRFVDFSWSFVDGRTVRGR